jgi:hypothetical protein
VLLAGSFKKKKDKIAILLPQVGDESGKYVNPTFPVFEPISIRI